MTDVFVFAQIHYEGISQIIEAYSKTYIDENMFKVFLLLNSKLPVTVNISIFIDWN